MGLLDDVTNSVVSTIAPGLLDAGKPPGPDFADGFLIEEVDDTDQSLALVGSLMPHIPFETGGEQKVQKDYYAGNSEPVVQVLGARESDLMIKGRIYEKHNKGSKRGFSAKVRDALDLFRIRGNLVRLKLGEWQRYGYMVDTKFSLKNLGDIEYEIKFSLVSYTAPKHNYFVSEDQNVPLEINDQLKLKLNDFKSRALPTVPTSLAALMNAQISNVAGAISAVTGYVDSTIAEAQDVNRSLNRALGLIKNAQASISQWKRQIGALSFAWPQFTSNTKQASKTLASQFVLATHSDLSSFRDFLEQMRARFAALSTTVPLRRYRVGQGDTLQKLAVKFYGNADNWKAIYDHNGLTSTVLQAGAILEIPKV